MRDFKGMKRQRGRNRKPGGGGANANNANPNRSWDSQGPENIKVRGNAQTVYERYLQLWRDASSSGDRVLAENYLQHAEHYFRVLRALQPARPVSEIAARELSNQGFDIDFEDESGAQAAAFLAAQQAAERTAQQQQEAREARDAREASREAGRDFTRGEGEDREPRAEGEEGQGDGRRRESRRERWERRREERNRRFDGETGGAEGGESASETGDRNEGSITAEVEAVPVEAPEVEAETRPARTERARRTRMPREGDADEAPAALPGFLTRSSAPATPAASETEGEAEPAPRRRAPRRKAETPVAED